MQPDGLDPQLLNQLEETLLTAPLGGWRGSAVPLSLLVALLQGCEGLLRRHGEHRGGDQLHHLLVLFLRRRAQQSCGEGALPDVPANADRREQLPRRQHPSRRRRPPGPGLLG